MGEAVQRVVRLRLTKGHVLETRIPVPVRNEIKALEAEIKRLREELKK